MASALLTRRRSREPEFARAPALRRTASWLEDAVAPHHQQPSRVRRLARDMRLRAVEIEIGTHSESGFDEMVDIVRSSRRMAA